MVCIKKTRKLLVATLLVLTLIVTPMQPLMANATETGDVVVEVPLSGDEIDVVPDDDGDQNQDKSSGEDDELFESSDEEELDDELDYESDDDELEDDLIALGEIVALEEGDEAPAPATSVTAVGTVEAESVSPNTDITVDFGTEIIMKAKITAVGGVAYGFTGAVIYQNSYASFVSSKWEADNPGIPMPTDEVMNASQGRIRISRDSDGVTPYFAADEEKTVTIRFKVIHMPPGNLTFNFGGSAQAERISLLTDPDVRIADLKDPETGVFYSNTSYTPPMIPADILAKTVVPPGQAWGRANITPEVSIALSSVDSEAKPIGGSSSVKLTVTSNADAYGFALETRYQNPYVKLDTTLWETKNPGIPVPTVSTIATNDTVTIVCESDGSKKVLEKGKPLEIILDFTYLNTFVATNVNYGQYSFVSCVFTDPAVRAFGEGGLLVGEDADTKNTAIRAAELEGKVSIAPNAPSGSAQLRGDYMASVVFSTENGTVGGNPRPITLTASISTKEKKAVYGLSAGISYVGGHLLLDEDLTQAANPGFTVEFGGITSPNSTSTWSPSIQKIYVESDGKTPIFSDGALDLKLVFLPRTGAGTYSVTSGAGVVADTLVLFTDPSVRAVETGEGLTTINFILDNISATERTGGLIVVGSTAGSIVTTKLLDDLTLDGSGYYSIANATDLQNFADAVNIRGENMIKGNITASNLEVPSTFGGIGTLEYPFKGELKALSSNNKLTVDYTITSGSNTVLGGVIKYLGEGGIVSNLTMDGSITVSGTTGNVSIGGAVGKSTGGRFLNITNNVAITATGVNGNIGGIAGTASQFAGDKAQYAFQTCKNNGTINGATNAGGLVGVFDGLDNDASNSNMINRSTNVGAISGQNVGAIVGNMNGGIVKESGNGIFVTQNVPRSGGGAISGTGNVGGVVGSATDAMIDNCYNSGNISGAKNLGGIAGQIDGSTTLTKCWNGEITISSSVANTYLGGIIGENKSSATTISFNFNLGSITTSGTNSFAGGITGKSDVSPALYKGNYYLTGTATADGLDNRTLLEGSSKAMAVAPASVFFTGANSNVPGEYTYLPPEPGKDGSGVYLLRSAEDFLWFASTVNTNVSPNENNKINAKLMNDINLSNEQFSGVGLQSNVNRYGGTFDGNGKTITAKLSTSNSTGIALFNYCASGAVIKNLTLKGSVTGNNGAAGIVYDISGGQIENCHNEASVFTQNGWAGGIAGVAPTTVFVDCTNKGAISNVVSGPYSGVGGIVASITGNASLDNCHNSGKISGGGSFIGGLIGAVSVTASGTTFTTVSITNSSNTGDVSILLTDGADTNYTSDSAAGGIVGRVVAGYIGDSPEIVLGTLLIDNVSNSGNVSGNARHLGGILARAGGNYVSNILITNSSNSGDIISTYSGQYDPSAGGIAGNVGDNFIPILDPDTGVSTNKVSGNIEGNTNTGNVSVIKGDRVSSTVASGQTPVIKKNNTTDKLFGDDANDKNLVYIGGNPGDDGSEPGDGGNPVNPPVNPPGPSNPPINPPGPTNPPINPPGPTNPPTNPPGSVNPPTNPTEPVNPPTNPPGGSSATPPTGTPTVVRTGQATPLALSINEVSPTVEDNLVTETNTEETTTEQTEKQPEEQADEPQEIGDVDTPLATRAAEGGNPAMIILVIAIIVIALLVGLYLFRSRRRNNAS